MKRGTTILLLIAASVLMLSACKAKKSDSQSILAPNTHEVKVQEFIHTTEYTYFRVLEGNAEYWMASPKRESKKGETLYYTTAYEMLDFKSTELDRVFDRVYFIQDLSDKPQGQMGVSPGETQVHMGTPRNQQQQQQTSGTYSSTPGEVTGTIDKEINLDELLTNPEEYSNKIVTISGKVIKVNPAIMARNWVHITADPDDGKNYDLTITCQDNVELDQLVTFKGQVSLNRDFGAGYTYQIIIENAKLISK